MRFLFLPLLFVFAISTNPFSNAQAHETPHYDLGSSQELENECPICMDAESSDEYMCANGHSMGCGNCVESLVAQSVASSSQSTCPLCRKAFELNEVKRRSAQLKREREAMSADHRIPELSSQEREELVRAHKERIINELIQSIDREALRGQVKEQIRLEERNNVWMQLGELGRQQIRAEHLADIRQAIRDNFSDQEVLSAQQQERQRIVSEVQGELRRQEEAAIRFEQQRRVAAGELVLIDRNERLAIEADEFRCMKDEESRRLRSVKRREVRENGVQLLSQKERQDLMQDVIQTLRREETERKASALEHRKSSIALKLWWKNGVYWLANWVPFVNIAYFNYGSDVEQRLIAWENFDPA